MELSEFLTIPSLCVCAVGGGGSIVWLCGYLGSMAKDACRLGLRVWWRICSARSGCT
jgi:hypothetical protein